MEKRLSSLSQSSARNEITPSQRDASFNAMLSDIATGVLADIDPPLDSVRTEAERLSALPSESLGTRSLDILHVASALVLGIPDFLSFDQGQSSLACAAGLNVPAL